jgi:hypothetical protein
LANILTMRGMAYCRWLSNRWACMGKGVRPVYAVGIEPKHRSITVLALPCGFRTRLWRSGAMATAWSSPTCIQTSIQTAHSASTRIRSGFAQMSDLHIQNCLRTACDKNMILHTASHKISAALWPIAECRHRQPLVGQLLHVRLQGALRQESCWLQVLALTSP